MKKQLKRQWTNTNLQRLTKRYDELNASFEEFKDTDSEADKLANITAKMFIKRIQKHLSHLLKMANLFNIYGFALMEDIVSENKAQELACLF